MGYLNKFATQAAYDAGKYDVDAPAISYIESTGDFIFDKTKPGRPNGVYIKYTDGSYSAYNVLEGGKTPVGVALKTDACALCIHPSEGENQPWNDVTSYEFSGVTTTNDEDIAKVDYSGSDNTTAIIHAGAMSGAFLSARQVVYADGSKGWFASCGEMEQIRLNMAQVNYALALINGTPVDFDNKKYICSTQKDATSCWQWHNQASYWLGTLKSDNQKRFRSVTYF